MSAPILIVEDERIVALDLQVRLEAMGYQVAGAARSGEEGIALAASTAPGLVLMDIHLGEGMDGIEAATRIRQTQDLPVVFLTAFADEATLARAKKAAPYGYLVKPFQELALRSTLEMALLRHHLELELKAREAQLQALLRHAHDIIVVLDPSGRITYNSPAVLPLLGYGHQENLGRSITEFFHPDDLVPIQKAIEELISSPAAVHTATARILSKDGSWRVFEAFGRNALDVPGVQGVVINARDVTDRVAAAEERRQLERQIQQAQKMESLGVLAGGIAHDFNNLLMGILGQAGLALMDLPEDHPAHDRVKRIELAAQRTAELTNQMLAYSGKGRFTLAQVDLSQLVLEMAKLLDTVISKQVKLHLDLPPGLPSIKGDPTQLRQVVMNLLTNASDSMGREGGGIRVRTGIMATRPDMPCLVGEAPPLRAVFLEVQDDGAGMDAGTLQRIFDPFFTTKFTGRGLGLSAVQGIVRGHRGAIQVKSAPAKGTTFRLLFPVSGGPPAEDRREPAQVPPRGTGLVLVVDDETYVREVARSALERQGYTVLTASDGTEGFDLYRAHAGNVKALVLDLTMPGMGGEELLRLIRSAGGEDIPAILSSGYANDEAGLAHLAGKPPRFLRKPYHPMDLVQLVAELAGGE